MSPAGDRAPWPVAASDLARRVDRRARAGAGLRATAVALLAGAVAAAAMRLFGGPLVGAAGLVGIAALLGALFGLRAAARVRSVSPGDAAWALDRLAGAGERGLTAAAVAGPAGAEAAWAGTPIAPPRVRLYPPAGLVPALVAALLAATVLAWPAPTARGARAPGGGDKAVRRGPGSAAGDALEARRKEAEAAAAARDAAGERAVREALGLPPSGHVDPAELASLLASKEARERATKAAPPTSAAGAALATGGPDAARALSRALDADPLGTVDALRREAASLSASGGALPVPPSRRALVARYLAARLARDPVVGEGDGAR